MLLSVCWMPVNFGFTACCTEPKCTQCYPLFFWCLSPYGKKTLLVAALHSGKLRLQLLEKMELYLPLCYSGFLLEKTESRGKQLAWLVVVTKSTYQHLKALRLGTHCFTKRNQFWLLVLKLTCELCFPVSKSQDLLTQLPSVLNLVV